MPNLEGWCSLREKSKCTQLHICCKFAPWGIHLPSLLVVVKIPVLYHVIVIVDGSQRLSICQLCPYDYLISDLFIVVTCEGVKACNCRPKFQPQKLGFQGEEVPYLGSNMWESGSLVPRPPPFAFTEPGVKKYDDIQLHRPYANFT